MDIFQAATGVSLWNAITFMLLGGIVFAGIQFLTGRKAMEEENAKLTRLLDAANTLLSSSQTTIPSPLRNEMELAYITVTGRLPDAIDAEFSATQRANAKFVAEREQRRLAQQQRETHY